MMFSFQRPWAFWGILLLVPAILLFVMWYKRITRSNFGRTPMMSRLKMVLPARILCWSVAWIMLIVSLGGPSWGTHLVPLQQTGASVSLVFDISWSMMAQDVPSGKDRQISRLEAAASYGKKLLDHLMSTQVSVVIAKGEGVVAIPLTGDFNAIHALLPSLSPRLITTTGSNLGSGLQKASASFPLLSMAKKTILVFTDGEDTDGSLESETQRLVSAGIDVIFLGFGSVGGTEIVTGDGKTVVHSSLQEEKLEALVESVNTTARPGGNRGGGKAMYIPAQSLGSAHKVLATVTGGQDLQNLSEEDGQVMGTTYHLETKERWRVFAGLALMFFFAGFIFAELDPVFFKRILRFTKNGGKTLALLFLVGGGVFFQGCTKQWQGAASVLEGTFFWHQGKYQKAIAGFMEAMDTASTSNQGEVLQYSIYGLATTYIMQGETEAALGRLQEITPDAPESLAFAALYNSGVISYNQGNYQEAATLFRKALEIDGSSLDAKINLELSLGQDARQGGAASQELIPVQETPSDDLIGSTLFSLIRKQEEDRWKNQQGDEVAPTGDDY